MARPHLVVEPGTFGLARLGGAAGWFIGLGQWIIGDGSRYSHAFVVLDDRTVVEARPGGARVVPLTHYFDGTGPLAFGWVISLDEKQRDRICSEARDLVGTPYNFLDYVALGLAHLGIRPAWLRRFIARSDRMICSQLVDECYRRAGVHLFTDGRLAQDVTPGDLANVLIERDWSMEWA